MNIGSELCAATLGHFTSALLSKGAGELTWVVVQRWLKRQFHDPSQCLPNALVKAHEESWTTLEKAVQGKKGRRRDQKSLIERLQHSLNSLRDEFGGDFNDSCVREFRTARKSNVFTLDLQGRHELLESAVSLARFDAPDALVKKERECVQRASQALRHRQLPHLAKLTRLRLSDGRPLFAFLVDYFFRREVSSNEELFRSLTTGRLDVTVRQLAESIRLNVDQLGRLEVMHEKLDKMHDDIGGIRQGVEQLSGKFGGVVTELLEPVRKLTRTMNHRMKRMEAKLERLKQQANKNKKETIQQYIEKEERKVFVTEGSDDVAGIASQDPRHPATQGPSTIPIGRQENQIQPTSKSMSSSPPNLSDRDALTSSIWNEDTSIACKSTLEPDCSTLESSIDWPQEPSMTESEQLRQRSAESSEAAADRSTTDRPADDTWRSVDLWTEMHTANHQENSSAAAFDDVDEESLWQLDSDDNTQPNRPIKPK